MSRLLPCTVLLCGSLTAAAQQPVEPAAERAARLLTNLDADSGSIVQIQPDSEGGVWALTRNGKLYYCQRRGDDANQRIHCIGKEGETRADY